MKGGVPESLSGRNAKVREAGGGWVAVPNPDFAYGLGIRIQPCQLRKDLLSFYENTWNTTSLRSRLLCSCSHLSESFPPCPENSPLSFTFSPTSLKKQPTSGAVQKRKNNGSHQRSWLNRSWVWGTGL